MKKTLSLFGIFSIAVASSASILGGSISKVEKYNNFSKNKCNITDELANFNQTCNNENTSKYEIRQEIQIGYEVRTMYIDEWVVNSHYDWSQSPESGEYNYKSVLLFLESSIPNFKKEMNERAKEVFVKTFMTESLQYANKNIGGMYISLSWFMSWPGSIRTVGYGIFDTWKNSPLEGGQRPSESYKVQFLWQQKVENDIETTRQYGMPKYNRYGDINKLKRDFEYFTLPFANVSYHINHETKMFLQWKHDIFPTTVFNFDQPTYFKQENFDQNGNQWIRLKTTYKVLVDYETINIVTEADVLALMPANTKYGLNIDFGDYFVLLNHKEVKSILENYNNLEKSLIQRQLPPTGGSSALSTAFFQVSNPNDVRKISVKLNHAIIHTLSSALCVVSNLSTELAFDQIFRKLFSQYVGSTESERNIIINMMSENLDYHFPGRGITGLVAAYYQNPQWVGSNYGLEFRTGTYGGAETVYYLEPWQ
ncbi:hypothetical protein [Spiroplasma endosymbiont of Cantharis lateralis]|uniref:hypothetical protein n=1 Tax=Spiroplasma endosymbiont of Cantharis lateralis TaxID=3066277 RepID=UPI00313BE90A